jgi:acetyl esterase/lipase
MASSVQTLTYAVHDGVELKGDLYSPAGPGPYPVLIGVPGGGWRRGDRTGFKIWGEYLSSNGVALFSVDHRKSNDGPIFPQNVQDVLAAAQFICGEAERLSLDPGRLGIMGSSAGAHLAAMTALAGDTPLIAKGYAKDAHAEVRPDFKILIGVYGVYDLFTHWQVDTWRNAAPDEDYTERFLGCTPYHNQQLYFDASPIRHVCYEKNAIKTLLIWGDEDREILPVQSEAMLKALSQARFFVRSLPVKGAGHFWFSEDRIEDPKGFNSFVAPRLLRFLGQHLIGRAGHGGG